MYDILTKVPDRIAGLSSASAPGPRCEFRLLFFFLDFGHLPPRSMYEVRARADTLFCKRGTIQRALLGSHVRVQPGVELTYTSKEGRLFAGQEGLYIPLFTSRMSLG